MAPKKTPQMQTKPELVELAYHGEAERRFHDPATGTDYHFRPGEATTIPRELAERLQESDGELYAMPGGA